MRAVIMRIQLALSPVILLLMVASTATAQSIRFTDQTNAAGVAQPIDPNALGHGVAIADFTGNGRPDLYHVSYEAVNSLFRNDGNGRFTDIASQAGVQGPATVFDRGIAVADFDNDGDVDIYITTAAGSNNILFRNNGNGTFTDIAGGANLTNRYMQGQGVAWGDFNNDGLLDLFLASHSNNCLLFRQNSNNTFTDVTQQAGLANVNGIVQGVFFDVDLDGDLDLFLAGGANIANRLFINQGNGSFVDRAAQWNVTDPSPNGQGVAIGDFDGDGDLDIFMSAYAGGNRLYRNDGNRFTEVSVQAGVRGDGRRSLGAQFADFNNNGWLDLYVLYFGENKVYRNNGDGTFTDQTSVSGGGDRNSGYGSAVTDYDNDGRLDIFFSNTGQKSVLLQNTTDSNNNWLKIDLTGRRSNRDGVGARLLVDAGGRRQVHQLLAGFAMVSSGSDLTFHVGLGQASRADRLEIIWPSGERDVMTNVNANQRLAIEEGSIGDTPPDTTPPVISAVAVQNVTETTVDVVWTTDEAGDSQVEYGLTTSYGQTSSLSTARVTSHRVTLTGLQSGTTYNYRVRSRDAAGNLGTSGNFTFTTAPDVAPPVLSQIRAENISDERATIRWRSNEAADSQVEYGLDTNYGSMTTHDPALVTEHTVELTGLQPNTTYNYRVRSRDAADNLAISDNFVFTTAPPDITPPAISAVVVDSITVDGATITWTTDESADSQVEYGLTTSYGSLTALDPQLVTQHRVRLSGLQANRLYHFRVISNDAKGNRAVSGSYTFATKSGLTPSFTDVTLSAGILGTLGGHAAIFAPIADPEFPDIYITNLRNEDTSAVDLFYRNRGDGTFIEEGVLRGIDDYDGGSHGAVFADLTNNGFFDLYNGATDATSTVDATNRFYLNDGTGFFTDVTAERGLPARSWETRAVLAFDMDGDGHLDLFAVTNYQGSNDPPGEQNELYRNLGYGYFEPVASGALVDAPAGQGATAADYDGDGDIDIIAANRTGEVNILRNDGAGNFTKIAAASIGITERAEDGITLGDVNNDGYLDMLVAGDNYGHLFLNNGNGTFSFKRSFANTDGYMGAFGDLDNDGDLDLVFAGDDVVYLNDGKGNFTAGPAVPVAGINDPRAIAFADIDGDGDLDFLYANKRSRSWLVRNNLNGGNWLKVRLVSPQGQAGAFGAKTRIYPPGEAGGTLLGLRESRSANGYLGQNDPTLHFGLGAYTAVEVEVTFPDGTVVTRSNVGANQSLLIDASVPDTQPPVLSAIAAGDLTDTQATITWETDELATSQVEYGVDLNYGQTTTERRPYRRSHAVILTGLMPNTTYNYRVKSRDGAGNQAVSSNLTFTTAAPDTTPPVISAVTAGPVTATTAEISWLTGEAADSQVEYGLTTSYGSLTPLDPLLVTDHRVTLTGLQANSTYHFRVLSRDEAGNLARSDNFTFRTAVAPAYAQRVNASGSAFTGTDGRVWDADRAFTTGSWGYVGGNSFTTSDPISGTDDDALYQSERYGMSAYRFTVPENGSYLVTLHFAEIYYQANGKRIFDVSIEGQLVLDDLDIYSRAGHDAALVYSFETNVNDGVLDIDFGVVFELPKISAIEVKSAVDVTPPVLSGISAGEITQTSAAITWTSNEGADSQVEYGLTTSYGSATAVDPALVTNHRMVLSGLQPGTSYQYRVKSKDASGNLAVSGNFSFTTEAPDTTAPAITAVTAAAITQTGATITWTTDETSDSQVEYGLTTSYGSTTAVDPALVTSHRVALAGLQPGTTYQYRVKSKDGSGNLAVSGNFSFTTEAPDTTAPAISAVAAEKVGTTSAEIVWSTDEGADSQVEYGLTTSYGSTTAVDPALVTSHRVKLSGLQPGTTYQYRVKSKDGSGNLAVSGNFSFTTVEGDVTPPVISLVSAGEITASSVAITWTTDETSDSQVEYGLTASYGSTTAVDPALVTSHRMVLSGLQANTSYNYRVKSKDSSGNLAVSGNFSFKTTSSSQGRNVARLATASASSEDANWGQTANKAIDGVVDGFPGKIEHEWATRNQGVGAWLQLDFPEAYTIDRVVLHDRPNTNDHIRGAELRFSDGSVVAVGALANDGSAVEVRFSARTVSWLRMTVTQASGQNVGLAEILVWEVASTSLPALTLSNVRAQEITTSGAAILWTTNRASDSQVEYGLTTSYGSATAVDPAAVTSHRVALSGLQPGTTYQYRVLSRDSNGTLAVSSNFSFTTEVGLESSPLALYQVGELFLSAANAGETPYTSGPAVTVTFTGTGGDANGKSLDIDGFWDGGNTYRVRFVLTATGQWSWRSSSTDAGLDGLTGTLTCSGFLAGDHAARRGFITESTTNPYTFVDGDSIPFFIMGDTQWSFSTDSIAWPVEFQTYVDARAAQGFNYVHGVMYQTFPTGNDSNEGGQAFENNDVDRLNPEFWQAFDQRVAYLNEKGIVGGLMLSWATDGWSNFATIEQVDRFLEYAANRYAAYNIFWITSGEYEESDPPGGHDRLGQVLRENDPYKHPMTTHTIRSSATGLADKAWHTTIYQQTGQASLITEDRVYDKPVINSEFGYEGNIDAEQVRLRAWEIVMRGGFFVYGNRTTYHYSARMTQENLYSPGAEYMSILKKFWTDNGRYVIDWWTFSRFEDLGGGSFLAAAPGSQYIVFSTSGDSLAIDLSDASGDVTGHWFDTRSGVWADSISGQAASEFALLPPGPDFVAFLSAQAPGGLPFGAHGKASQAAQEMAEEAAASPKPSRAIPANFALSHNYPNPFNIETRLDLDLPEAGELRAIIFDVRGRLVRELWHGPQSPGYHHLAWDGFDASGQVASSGVYLLRLIFEGQSGRHYLETRRMVLLK